VGPVGIIDGEAVVWFSIGSHAEYDRFLRTLRAIAPNHGMQPPAFSRS